MDNNKLTNILVTGASGFIGAALRNHLISRGHRVVGVIRKNKFAERDIIVDDISEFDGWQEVLKGIEVIVHLAGRAHILNDRAANSLEDFRRVNTSATINLAEHAVFAGVKRFVFISSIGVNGNVTQDRPITVTDAPFPHSPYARSKYEAEIALKNIASNTGLEAVIIRPPLVYGPNAPGNFQTMLRWLLTGLPLPLGAVTKNRRSLVSLDNLVDLIATCIDHPSAANQTFLISDGEDLSTTDLLLRMSRALGTNPKLLSVPVPLMRFAAKAIRREDIAKRLIDNLQIDIAHTCDTLNWRPPFTVDEGLARVAAHVTNISHYSSLL